MTDIVERLRVRRYSRSGETEMITLEAAAEIERLRAALEPILNYPGIKDKIGSVLYDAGYAALSALEGK